MAAESRGGLGTSVQVSMIGSNSGNNQKLLWLKQTILGTEPGSSRWKQDRAVGSGTGVRDGTSRPQY